MASLMGLVYFILCAAYIWISTTMAFATVPVTSTIYYIELVKGMLFVLASTLAFAAFVFLLMRRVNRVEQAMTSQHAVMQLYQQQASSGLLASTIAHDMNNMLMVLQARVLLMSEQDVKSEGYHANVDDLQRHLDDLISLAERLQNSARASMPAEFEDVDVCKLAFETLEFARQHPRAGTVNTSLSCPQGGAIHLRGNGIVLRQMLLNLLVNAIDAASARPEAHVKLVVELAQSPDRAILEVHDNGPGVPEDQRELIFTPYFTTKNSGTGLGLLSVKAGVKSHGGTLSVLGSPLGGACFRVELPLERM